MELKGISSHEETEMRPSPCMRILYGFPYRKHERRTLLTSRMRQVLIIGVPVLSFLIGMSLYESPQEKEMKKMYKEGLLEEARAARALKRGENNQAESRS